MNTKIEALRNHLNAMFPERKDVVQGLLTAVLCREHVLLLGPPGTAKSAITRALVDSFSGTYFERLLTKFSTPEELFGPISLKALEQDRFARVTAGKLPEVEFAFVDEVFKANSAILNSLLAVMNERVFHNDGAPMKCPLVTLFGASNELPEGKELEAMFDRFLLRFDVKYLVRRSNLRAVLTSAQPTAAPAKLTMDDLRAAQAEVEAVKVSDATVDGLMDIREACAAEGIVISDRRWKQALKAVKASAYFAGETETTPDDLGVLADSLWREPKERTKVAAIVGRFADPLTLKVTEIVDIARESFAKVKPLDESGKPREDYVADAARTKQAIAKQVKALGELTTKISKRNVGMIDDAIAEVKAMEADLAGIVSKGLGLGARAGVQVVK